MQQAGLTMIRDLTQSVRLPPPILQKDLLYTFPNLFKNPLSILPLAFIRSYISQSNGSYYNEQENPYFPPQIFKPLCMSPTLSCCNWGDWLLLCELMHHSLCTTLFRDLYHLFFLPQCLCKCSLIIIWKRPPYPSSASTFFWVDEPWPLTTHLSLKELHNKASCEEGNAPHRDCPTWWLLSPWNGQCDRGREI